LSSPAQSQSLFPDRRQAIWVTPLHPWLSQWWFKANGQGNVLRIAVQSFRKCMCCSIYVHQILWFRNSLSDLSQIFSIATDFGHDKQDFDFVPSEHLPAKPSTRVFLRICVD
jgi:hypothetical protein